MYVLNPTKESHDYKDMMKQWSNAVDHFSSNKYVKYISLMVVFYLRFNISLRWLLA